MTDASRPESGSSMSAQPQPSEPDLATILQNQTGNFTVHDLEALDVDEKTRLELIEGWLYMTPPVGNEHQDLVADVFLALTPVVPSPLRVRPSSSVYGSGIRSWIEPDVAVLDPSFRIGDKGYDIAGVRLAVEVTSPSTRGRDLIDKREHYARHEVPYLVIDRGRRPYQWLFLGHLPEWAVVLDRMAKSGEYRPADIRYAEDYRLP